MRAQGRAFTLVELLFVLGIVSVVSLLAIPALHTFTRKVGHDLSLQATIATLDRARSMAVLRNVRVGVCMLDTSASCAQEWAGTQLAVFLDENANWQRDRDEKIIYQQPWPAKDLKLRWSNWLQQPVISYQPDGSVVSNGTLSFEDEEGIAVMAIVISKPGRARIK